jgi:hypothetical protein
MANSKRFVVKNGLETQNIQFVTADGTEKIIATVLEDGTLSFSGTSGQLFSIVDSLTGSIFSVNDISGIPSIEVFDDGKVILAESTGNVGIGTLTPTEKLHVAGNINIPTGSTYKINGVNLSASNVGAEPANANIQTHISSTTNPHSVTATQVGLGNVTNESKATMFASPTFTGTVSGVTKSMVGLGNVDNTSDASKPVSTATQTALNLKANLAGPTFTGTVSGITASMVGLGNVTNESKATMFTSPTFTGTPVAPTATSGTNTTQVATTAFVSTAVANLINSAPGALDTLDELAAALGDDANFASTVTTALAGKSAIGHTHTVANITDLTATASELNVLDGITSTTAELNFTDGVTSNIQTQLDGTVKTTGDQSIAGTKTFTAIPAFNGGTSGTSAPFSVDSTQVVTNLNADLLDGNHASAFYLATNPSGYTTNTGTVTSVGITAGTGISVANSPITTSGSITVTNSAPNATHTGDVTGATALTIANNVVTLPKMANLVANSIIGNNTASPATPIALNATQVRTLLNVADGATANTGTVTSVSAGTQISGMAMTITDGTTTPSIATSITNAANFRTAIGAGTGNGTVTAVTGTAPIASSGGTTPAISISAATQSSAGSMSSADKTKLDGIASGAQVNVGTNLTWTAGTTAGPVVNSSTGTGVAIPLASATASGVLSNAAQTIGGDKTFTSRILTNDRIVIGDLSGYDVPYIAWGGSSNTYQLSIADYAYENPVIIDTQNAKVTAATFASNVATGTSPFTVASTTVVPSLNADLLDGNHASAFVLKSGDTINGNLTVNGNIINTGSTITVNTSNLTVTDKNIELGFITPKTGLVATLATGTANITLTTGTTEGMIPGQALTKTSGTGVFGASARIATITGLTTLTATINHATAGSITFTASGSTDFTADGGGITLKGDSDHRIEWNKNLLGGGAWSFLSDRLYLLNEDPGGDKLVIEDTDLEIGSVVKINSNSSGISGGEAASLLSLFYSGTTSSSAPEIYGVNSVVYAQTTNHSTAPNYAYGGQFIANFATHNYGILVNANGTAGSLTSYGVQAYADGPSGSTVYAIKAAVGTTPTTRYTFHGTNGILYNSDSVGIGTDAPLNKLDIRITGADSNNGIMISRVDSTTTTNEILGGIGFDSTDGNVPSSVLEASAYIAAFAAEDHSTGDKGGYLTFGTSPIDQDDDTVSTERMRIEAGGNIGIGTATPSAKLDVAGDIEHTGLTMTSGTNVDQLKETTFTSALTTAWTDVTGVSGTYLATGSYIVQIISNGEYYTGEMSWFSGTTTSTVADEIILHRAGPAASAGRIFARVIRTSSAPSTLKLQVSGSTSISSHTMTFKFRRTI